jgi:hypothetical protein
MVKSRNAVSDLPVGETKRLLTLRSSIAGFRMLMSDIGFS